MVLAGLFAHRSGRVISLSRLALSASFAAIIWLDPSQPRAPETPSFAILGSYIAWSLIVLLLTWSSWRWDNRLANSSHVVDVGMFGLLVFLTEGYTSPYFIFFVFLLLSSAIRWGWRETALTAVAIMILFVTAGASASIFGASPGDLFTVLTRCIYLVILSALFIWFGINQAQATPAVSATFQEALSDNDQPTAEMLRIASAHFDLPRLLLAWTRSEEPWLQVTVRERSQTRRERFAPDHFGPLLSGNAGDRAFLFDNRRGLALRRRDDDPNRFVEFAERLDPVFASHFALRHGLVVPIRTEQGEGQLFVGASHSLCSDDIGIGEKLARELALVVDRSAALAYSEEAAVRRAKTSLARDLHDGVMQSLTGASLKLAGIRASLEEGEDVRGDLDALRRELATEQRNIRAFTESLRSGRGPTREVDLSSGLPYIVEEFSQRWGIVCRLSESAGVEGPVWMEHDLHQMAREAAANAVRHGGATSVEIEMRPEAGGIELCITDNGRGYPSQMSSSETREKEIVPRSLRERTEGLGGRIRIEPTPNRCRTTIWVPLHANS
jgi:signal transduction histidine kinase